ncbi:hypothetical protein MA5S0921_5364 [Mycobacteroides abscessus 5S-0921]|nr:hypothetical protein MA5S0421_4639 [Mycobacteroides abscessus 5S-0421]EIU11412.1 hypothetical protein MA5S0304_4403 [Mycobacteroides abscessus 5S-0304]EIU23115.1 hypothetical protein MA5S0817_3952 [Mycobacteroides abscessus 5S-0817]EIU42214.1 hypothetical protein MA5S1215_4356 [Mycobacteroides abscessus 5S-1215]EIU85853.1 hypothetical protein MA5S0921_5364 [Mycobacteroides abscessus 5S-0921]
MVSTRRWLRRTSGAASVAAVVAAAVSLPAIAPERAPGVGSVVAIARADCPPDCGPGGGGNPSGPPGGGTEFVPPSAPAMPSYEPGRGQPPLDQNNGISIYNSNTPQAPTQPGSQISGQQQSGQNLDGSWQRAANGEQQPISYPPAPYTQGPGAPNPDYQAPAQQPGYQPEQQSPQQYQTQAPKPQVTQPPDSTNTNERQLPDEDADGADRGDDLSKEECQRAADAVQSGEDIPEDLLKKMRDNEGSVRNGEIKYTLDPAVDDKYRDIIMDAIEMWNSGSKVQLVPGEGPDALTFQVKNMGKTPWVALWDPHNNASPHTITINTYFTEGLSKDPNSPYQGPMEVEHIIGVVGHETGHAFGIDHTCPGQIMHGIDNQWLAWSPQAMDFATANQGR